jgi:hypothetical protein
MPAACAALRINKQAFQEDSMTRHGQGFGTDMAAQDAAGMNADIQAAPAATLAAYTVDAGVAYAWNTGNGDWNTATDWSPHGVPGAADSASFASQAGSYTVTGNATIGGITVDANNVTFDGTITQGGGGTDAFLTGIGGATVTLDANAFFDGGAISFAEGALLDVQGILIANGGTADTVMVEGLSASFVTASALDVTQLDVQSGGSFAGDVTLNDGGAITLDTSSTFGGNTITLLGSGTISDALGAGAPSGNAGLGDAISVAAGGTLTLAAGTDVNFAVGGPITGGGGVLITGGTVEFTGANSYTGETGVQDATLTLDGPGAVQNGLITLSGSLLNALPDSTGAITYTDTIMGAGASDTVNAAAGNLLVIAGQAGAFSFIGGAGTDTVLATQGALSVAGGAAGDRVFSGGAALNFTGGAGGSTVVGGTGIVNATGGSGGDLIYGGSSGHDVLNTGAGPATLVGGAGAQLFATGSASSLLVDGGGAQLNASASSGNDTLFGAGAGTNDTITSGAGTSTVVLFGGASEVFAGGTTDVFAGTGALTLAYIAGASGGLTNVEGFNAATDQIALSGFAAGTAAQILANETIAGGGTILQIPQGDQVVLFGVTNLTLANFT